MSQQSQKGSRVIPGQRRSGRQLHQQSDSSATEQNVGIKGAGSRPNDLLEAGMDHNASRNHSRCDDRHKHDERVEQIDTGLVFGFTSHFSLPSIDLSGAAEANHSCRLSGPPSPDVSTASVRPLTLISGFDPPTCCVDATPPSLGAPFVMSPLEPTLPDDREPDLTPAAPLGRHRFDIPRYTAPFSIRGCN